MTSPPQIQELAARVLAQARARGLKIATAESCTGGMVSAALTDIAGSSDVFDRGFVTYSNDAKQVMLGVPAATIAAHGAVSSETATAMATGAIVNSVADVSVAITGVAGPGGGSAAKPVGLVHFALALRGAGAIPRHHLFGDPGRAAIREQATRVALEMLLEAVT